MNSFFRRIRRSLLKKSKFKKYLLYALGEIILVVVGILIAFQINKEYELVKLNRLEVTLLKEMSENLQYDIADMNENKSFHSNAMTSANYILAAFKNDSIPADSLLNHYGKVTLVPKFLLSSTAYTSLQKEGLRIIKNDSLRNSINSYYQIDASYMESWINSEWNTQFIDNREVYRKYFKEFSVFSNLVPVNYEELRNDQLYQNYLNNRAAWQQVTNVYYKRLIVQAEELMKDVDQEVASREDAYWF